MNINIIKFNILYNILFLSYSLVTLNLGCNRLTEVPMEIGNLHNLATLTLAENRIRHLPEGAFKQLICLKSLQLHNNQLSLLPTEIVKLNLVEVC